MTKGKSELEREGRVWFWYTGSEQQIFQYFEQRQTSEATSRSKKHRIVQWLESLVAEKIEEGVAKNPIIENFNAKILYFGNKRLSKIFKVKNGYKVWF